MLGSKDIDTINNSDIHDTYRNKLYLSEKEREEKLQSAKGLKARLGPKKAHGTSLTLTTQENAIEKTSDIRFEIPSDFDFFKHSVYPYGLKEDLIVKL